MTSQGNQQSDVTEDSGRAAGYGMTDDAGVAGYAGEGTARTSQGGADQVLDAEAVEDPDQDQGMDDGILVDEVIVEGVVVADDDGEPGVLGADDQRNADLTRDDQRNADLTGDDQRNADLTVDDQGGTGAYGAQAGTDSGGPEAVPDGASLRDPGLDAAAARGSASAESPAVAPEQSGLVSEDQAASPGTSPAAAAGAPAGMEQGQAAAAPTPAAQDISQRWHEIQAMFVDDPPGAVELAAAAANDAVTALVGVIQQRQESLLRAGGQEPGGDSTEQLRSALQDYRALFQNLENFAGQLSSRPGSTTAADPGSMRPAAGGDANATGDGTTVGSIR